MTLLPRTTLSTTTRAFRPAAPTVRPTAFALTLRTAALAFAPAALALALQPPTASAAPPTAVWPLSPRPAIVRGFEPPAKPWLPGHRGLDLLGAPGQPVLAATAGTITYAGPLAGRGVVVVTNGPLRTTYEPVIPTTHVGATITPGTQLGTLSTARTHCPPHPCLHWALLQSTTYLNPLSLLPTHPIRLLPPNTPTTTPTGARQPPTATDNPADGVTGDGAADGVSQPASAGGGAAGATAAGASGAASADSTGVRSSPSGAAADRGTGAATAVVGVAAALTLGGALLIRRH